MKTVVLLTAGVGSRMGKYANVINKTLLPVQDRAIISRIIEQFSEDTKFVVALGFKGDMVRSYLEIAHPNSKFSFVVVDNYDGLGSGPAYSLRCCQSHIDGPFYLIACDALYDGLNDIPTDRNYIGISKIDPTDSPAYCNVEVDGSKITKIVDKRFCAAGTVFNGALFIKDIDQFWNDLAPPELSSGWINLEVYAREMTWTDLGTIERYQKFVLSHGYDFSKIDEFLWINHERVIKWFRDSGITTNRLARFAIKPNLFPSIVAVRDGFYSYEFVNGKTLYTNIDDQIFDDLLVHLKKNLWPTSKRLSSEMCAEFYFNKTMKRYRDFCAKYPSFFPRQVNDTPIVINMESALKMIDWDSICNRDLEKRSAFIHGDLQFDNIIHDGNCFTFLDWRQDFAGRIGVGDLYYDIAKMLGGMIIRYDGIKNKEFEYSEDDGHIIYKLPSTKFDALLNKLKQEFPDPIIDQIVTLIFLNMAPLHNPPFDKLLFSVALQRLQALVDRK